MDDLLYRCKDLVFAYDEAVVLSLPALSIPRGGISVFLGGNGSGKTTLLKLLNGLYFPGRGTILFEGEHLQASGIRRVRENTVLSHQDPYLFSGTVLQNVGYGLKIRSTPHHVLLGKVKEALRDVGLEDFLHRWSGELSGGEKQRVAIARALALDPEVLLLDEPTANVDPESTRLIRSLLLRLSTTGKTIIMSTHNMDFGYSVGDHHFRLESGFLAQRDMNILKGHVAERTDHFTFFRVGSEVIRCPAVNGEFTTAVLPIDDVILSKQQLTTSAQNSFKGRVKALYKDNALYRVTLDCGFPVETHITWTSVEQLDVAIDRCYYVTFKASAVKLY